MKDGKKRSIAELMLLMVISGIYPVTALAQASEDQANESQDSDSQARVSGDDAIEEIIVTAQKREQNLQDVTSAVTYISGDDFDVMNISDPFDLSDKVPGLVVTKVQGYRRTVSIRGVGNEIPDNAATKPAVAYHVNGVFMTNDFALFHDLVDIARVEITRGPDGTIFGNSSSGGAINVVTKKPQFDEVTGFISGEIGSYSTTNVRGSFNLPFSDTVAARISASHRSHDGFTENVPNPLASPLNVLGAFNDLDDENDTSLNAHLLWRPTDDFSVLTSIYHFKMDINGPALKVPFDTVSDDPRVVSHDTTEFYRLDNNIVSLILDWTTPVANIRGLFSRQDYNMERSLDADRTSLTANDPAPLPTPPGDPVTLLGQFPIRQHVGGLTQRDNSYTAEIDIRSLADDDPFSWQGGMFFLDTEVHSDTRNFFDGDRDGNPVDTTVVGFGNPDTEFQNSDTRNLRSTAVFGNVGYALTDALSVSGGLRWTENEFTDFRCNIFSGCLTAAGRTGTPTTPSETEQNVTYKVTLEYNLADENMLYGSVATGVKPAASNNGFVETTDAPSYFPEVFEEEKVTAYAIGSKNFFFDRRVRLNVVGWYYDIENFLYSSAGLNVFGNGVSGGSNLPKSEAYGIEIESVVLLSDDLRLDVNLSASGSEITEGRLAVDRGEQVNITAGLTDPAAVTAAIQSIAQDLTGNELPKMPNFVANVRLSYDKEVSDSGLLTSTLSYNHRGEYFARVYNSVERDLVPSYDLVGLNFLYTPYDTPWSVFLNIQNLFDSDDVASKHTDRFLPGRHERPVAGTARHHGRGAV